MSTHAGIVETPEVLGGNPRIEGVRVGVLQVGDYVREVGMDVETVMDELRLSREQVEAALDYYDDHPDEMETLRAQREASFRRMEEQNPTPEELTDGELPRFGRAVRRTRGHLRELEPGRGARRVLRGSDPGRGRPLTHGAASGRRGRWPRLSNADWRDPADDTPNLHTHT